MTAQEGTMRHTVFVEQREGAEATSGAVLLAAMAAMADVAKRQHGGGGLVYPVSVKEDGGLRMCLWQPERGGVPIGFTRRDG